MPLDEADERAASLYVHVPFCMHKCHYCDFYSFVDRQERQADFVGALQLELGALAQHAARPLRTIFIGGGTPTLLRVELWERLLGALADRFDLGSDDLEFTVECNPETASTRLMQTLARGGVNRLSVGAQSFDSRHLRRLERRHDPSNVARALGMAQGAGIERLSLDLIFGIPSQTIDDWKRDLDAALEMEPAIEHLSCYALTYEPGTAMTRRLERGEFERCDDDLEASMYEIAVQAAAHRGLARYEISNFARPGAECRHNLVYWRSEAWLAAGPSASGHLAGHRWKNLPRLGDWIDGVRATGGYAPIVDHEAPDARRDRAERIMMGVRLREGIPAQPDLLEAARGLEQRGLLEIDAQRWALTPRGFLMADHVAGRLMASIA